MMSQLFTTMDPETSLELLVVAMDMLFVRRVKSQPTLQHPNYSHHHTYVQYPEMVCNQDWNPIQRQPFNHLRVHIDRFDAVPSRKSQLLPSFATSHNQASIAVG